MSVRDLILSEAGEAYNAQTHGVCPDCAAHWDAAVEAACPGCNLTIEDLAERLARRAGA